MAEVWRVDYEARAGEAAAWAEQHAAFARFAAAGAHIVRSTTPMSGWTGMMQS